MEPLLVVAGGAVAALGGNALVDTLRVEEGEPGRAMGILYATGFTAAGLALLGYGLVTG